MGANPAALLYDQLNAWNVSISAQSSTTVAGHRGLDSDPGMAIRRHAAALSNLTAIGELLDEAERLNMFPVQPYRDLIPEWGTMILSMPAGWHNTNNFNASALVMLGTLRSQLQPLCPNFPDGTVDEFDRALDEVLAALKDDPTISRDVKAYLLNLVIHMRLIIEEYRLNIRGDYDLSRAATLLRATVDTALETTEDDESKERWSGLKQIFSVQNAIALSIIQWSTVWTNLMLPPGG